MTNRRWLTKSRYRLALECPKKLAYVRNPDYANQLSEDPFFLALVAGGFQVGELAKLCYPGGCEIETREHEAALKQTEEYLEQENVILFEPAFAHENLFARVDVLVKNGNIVDLIEVKAKSWPPEEGQIDTKRGGPRLRSTWKPYVFDVAFQTHILRMSRPDWVVRPSLLLVDKTVASATTGLSQKFRIDRGKAGASPRIIVDPDYRPSEADRRLLVKIDVAPQVERILASEEHGIWDDKTFPEEVAILARAYANDEPIHHPLSAKCKNCQFRATPEQRAQGMKDGFRECWKAANSWDDRAFEQRTVLDLYWDQNTNQRLDAGYRHLVDVPPDELSEPVTNDALNRARRRRLQVETERGERTGAWIDTDALRCQLESWTYPLHFFDLENAAPALPMYPGTSPYKHIAFQFSIHRMHEDGRVEHAAEFLSAEPGMFPSFDFARALKESVGDRGTILIWTIHEQTVFRTIRNQLEALSGDSELVAFLDDLLIKENGRVVDMEKLAHQHHFEPDCNGSTSLKVFLDCVLNGSRYLQQRYSRPIYGAEGGIPSKNFSNQVWAVSENGRFLNPYDVLRRSGAELPEIDIEEDDPIVSDGGGAMVAFDELQYEELGREKREALRRSLLRYCELDTLAMVMIYEYWKQLLIAEKGAFRAHPQTL